MRLIIGAGILILLAGCAAGADVASHPPTWPAGELEPYERELLEMHDGIWSLIGLSPEAALELNTLVVKLHRNIKYDENRRGELEKLIIPGTLPRQSVTRAKFFENHRNRFRLLGISERTQAELYTAMSRVWTALHDENAPSEERKRAMKIRLLMVPELPPCQDDKIVEFREKP